MLVLQALVACAVEPVEWSPATTRVAIPTATARLAVDAEGRAVALTAPSVPDPPGACPGSVRSASRGATRFAAWWVADADGPARVAFARSSDSGTTWTAPVTVDARDHGGRGCNRPALALAIGEGSAYLHIVYWIEPADGAGLFFTHSMDAGGMFHAPVAVVYGGLPVLADVASLGDTVIVAHEDPNSPSSRLLLAISSTAGHIFERRLPVPAEGRPQSAPRLALRGRQLFVGWLDDGEKSLVVRSGVLGKFQSVKE